MQLKLKLTNDLLQFTYMKDVLFKYYNFILMLLQVLVIHLELTNQCWIYHRASWARAQGPRSRGDQNYVNKKNKMQK